MIQLMHGDCLEKMKEIPDGSVDMVLADLPFGTTDVSWDTKLPIDKLWDNWKRLLKPSGCVILNAIQPFTSELVMSNRKWFKYTLVWDKNKCGSPGLAHYRPMRTHEDIVVFAPSKTTYNPIMEKGEPYHRDPAKRVRCNNHGYGFDGHKGVNNDGTRFPKSIIKISRDFSAQQQNHPTQKPVPLMEWLVKTYTNEGDMVLDCCMGIGSTGLAAKNLNRSFIGIELDENYFNIASKRING